MALELPTGRLLRTFPRQTSIVQVLAISADGRWLSSGCWGGTVKLGNLMGQEVRTFATAKERNIY